MKLLLRTYFPLLLLLLFQFCISPDDVNKTIDDEEEEEEEEEVVLEDPTDLPFTCGRNRPLPIQPLQWQGHSIHEQKQPGDQLDH